MVIKDFDGDICDPEYMTPQQVAAMRELDRLRNAKAQALQPEPLTDSWFVSAHSAPGETYVTVLDMEAEFMPDVHVAPGTTGLDSTIGASQVQTGVVTPSDVSGLFSADGVPWHGWQEEGAQVTQGDGTNTYAQWLADIERHREINGTTGQESEA